MEKDVYKDLIDELVRACQKGQGQIGPDRCRNGLWNQNATADCIKDQHEINLLLKAVSSHKREIIATMLEQQFVAGVFEALRALHEFQISPFEDGYEGSPFNDFIGRLADWEWPEVKREW